MPELGSAVWAAVVAITLFSGLVKGSIGLGQPLIMVTGLTMLLPPQLAIAGILFPIVLSNVMQTFRTGLAPAVAAMKDFWRYTLIVCVVIAIFAQIVPYLEPRIFYLITGTWGPTTVLYLLAIDTPKARQVVVQGVIYGIGAVVLFVAHIKSGILNADTAPFSAALIVPSVIGMWIGFRIQDRLDQEVFRKATLVLLTVAGANLIWKGIA